MGLPQPRGARLSVGTARREDYYVSLATDRGSGSAAVDAVGSGEEAGVYQFAAEGCVVGVPVVE
ncbi:hypothetical protein GCM10029976_013620 [Kribbella albertanoniae]